MGRGGERLPQVRCVKGVQCEFQWLSRGLRAWVKMIVFMFTMYITVDCC